MQPVLDLVELCAGSAALSMWWLGGNPPIAYQGSKCGYASQIGPKLGLSFGEGKAHQITLVEIGPWAEFWMIVRDERQRILDRLTEWTPRDPFELWHVLKSQPVPLDRFERVVTWSVLQFWNYARIPVIVKNGNWKTTGFNRTEAYASQRTDIRLLKDYRLPYLATKIANLPCLTGLTVIQEDVREVAPRHALVLIDPPYQGTINGYQENLLRKDVLKLAVNWRDAGSFVAVCEQEPLYPDGQWWHVEMQATKGRTFSKQKQEIVTLSRPPLGQQNLVF